MAGNIVTLYIDDSNIRILMIKGKRVIKFATMPIEPGLMEDGVVTGKVRVAASLKSFLKEKKIKTSKVILGISGLQCLTRNFILPQLPGSLLSEAVLREAGRMMPLASEQYYLLWHTIPSLPHKMQVFVTAIRHRSTDSVIETLKLAGITIASLDIKPLSLSRLAKEPTAFIVDVQPTEFDIVVMINRIPQPIRTVSFPSEPISWDEKQGLIQAELDRTIEFYNNNNPDNPLSADIPIYVSGEMADHADMGEPLSSELGQPLNIPLATAISDNSKGYYNYMANFGLALLHSSLQKMAGPSIANSNLLPQVFRPKPISLVRIAVLPAAITFIVLMLAVVILSQSTSGSISSLRNQLETTNRLITQEQVKKNALKQQLTQTRASLESFSTALSSLDEQGKFINGDLDTAVIALPGSIKLRDLNHAIKTMTINGRSLNEGDLLSYARKLDASNRFGEVIISSVLNEDESMDFILILKEKEQP
ncbi:pilus assembly protein PilM [Chloroflexota bacterium]